jgi:hypothetical protein
MSSKTKELQWTKEPAESGLYLVTYFTYEDSDEVSREVFYIPSVEYEDAKYYRLDSYSGGVIPGRRLWDFIDEHPEIQFCKIDIPELPEKGGKQ